MAVGKIFFAWVSAGEAFDAQTHAREDEQVFDLKISEREGEFATASVVIENPRIGLLAPARKQRAFISAEIGSQIMLLFSGRVIGVPANITGQTAELEFVARPDDHAAVLADFIQQLKSLPQYDDALVSEDQRDDPTAVLEGFAGLLFWDRTTGALSLAPIANEGTQTVTDIAGDFFEDSLDISFSSAPIDSVSVEIDVSYIQKMPVFSKPWFRDTGGVFGGAWSSSILSGYSGFIQTLTPDDFISRWLSPGDTLDGGWTVAGAYLEEEAQEKVTVDVPTVAAPPRDPEFTGQTYPIDFFAYKLRGNLVLQGMYEQPRRETVRIDVAADLQPVVEFGESEVFSLFAEGADIATETPLSITQSWRAPEEDGDGYVNRLVSVTLSRAALARPLLCGDAAISSGVIGAAIARARARLAKAARCVTAAFELPFEDAVGLSSASVCRIADPRIPGGSMSGKVTSLDFEIRGDGVCVARVEIGASIGKAAAASTPAISGISAAAPPEPAVVTRCRNFGGDDGSFATKSVRLRNPRSAQENAIRSADIAVEISPYAALGYKWAQDPDDEAALEVLERTLQENPTELDAEFQSLEPEDETITVVSVTLTGPAAVVRDIDLEASS